MAVDVFGLAKINSDTLCEKEPQFLIETLLTLMYAKYYNLINWRANYVPCCPINMLNTFKIKFISTSN